jgi:hypothetical protein
VDPVELDAWVAQPVTSTIAVEPPELSQGCSTRHETKRSSLLSHIRSGSGSGGLVMAGSTVK